MVPALIFLGRRALTGQSRWWYSRALRLLLTGADAKQWTIRAGVNGLPRVVNNQIYHTKRIWRV
jgi:hypothetical protein